MKPYVPYCLAFWDLIIAAAATAELCMLQGKFLMVVNKTSFWKIPNLSMSPHITTKCAVYKKGGFGLSGPGQSWMGTGNDTSKPVITVFPRRLFSPNSSFSCTVMAALPLIGTTTSTAAAAFAGRQKQSHANSDAADKSCCPAPKTPQSKPHLHSRKWWKRFLILCHHNEALTYLFYY